MSSNSPHFPTMASQEHSDGADPAPKKPDEIRREAPADAFAKYDQDRSGFVSVNEFRAVLSSVFEEGFIHELVENYYINHDGKICWEEFMAAWVDGLGRYGSGGCCAGHGPKTSEVDIVWLRRQEGFAAGGGRVPHRSRAGGRRGTGSRAVPQTQPTMPLPLALLPHPGVPRTAPLPTLSDTG
ncbi:hypothetical protein DFJ74DRAFT_306839 [Hyaloraphidium curvatum]|nr:hypothetical protein DFJ74DRAFT_306839 [Hyaloraphidium curvatum]